MLRNQYPIGQLLKKLKNLFYKQKFVCIIYAFVFIDIQRKRERKTTPNFVCFKHVVIRFIYWDNLIIKKKTTKDLRLINHLLVLYFVMYCEKEKKMQINLQEN